MPSPIAHTVVGYLVYRAARERLPNYKRWHVGPLPLLLGIAVLFSVLPDVDAVFGILAGDFGRFHNNGTHSLVLAFAIALLVAGAIWFRLRKGFLSWFFICFFSYASHVLMDFFTLGGRGVMLLWPFTTNRYDSSFKLFYGVRWSNGFFAIEHLWTILTEVGFVLVVILIFRVGSFGTRRLNSLGKQFDN